MATEGSVLRTSSLEGSAQSSSLPVSGVLLLSWILGPSLILTAFQFMCSDPNMPQIQMSPLSSCGHKPVVKQQASENLQGTQADKAPAAAFPVRFKYALHAIQVFHYLPPTTSALQHHSCSGPMPSATKQMRFIVSLSLTCP